MTKNSRDEWECECRKSILLAYNMQKKIDKMFSLQKISIFLGWVFLLVLFTQCTGNSQDIKRDDPRTIYDKLLSASGNGEEFLYEDNCTGRITYNERYFMESLLNMYELTHEKRYIETFVAHADHVLQFRDDRAGRKDFAGHLRPGWQTGAYYTLGVPIIIPDSQGNPSLQIQGIHKSGNNHTIVEVRGNGNTFSLIIYNGFRNTHPLQKTISDVTMDTIEERINAAASPDDWVFVKKLGQNLPLNGTYPLSKTYQMVIHELHTPLIGTPFLRFAVLAYADPALKKYRQKAEEYADACEESYRDYEDSWREDGGYFVFEPQGKFFAAGIPVPYNALSANGRFLLWLYKATGKQEYLKRSSRLAHTVRSGITILPDKTLTMSYWYGLPYKGWKGKNPINGLYTQSNPQDGIEDTSHFTFTLSFMMDAYKTGLVFDDVVMQAAAQTFLQKVWNPQEQINDAQEKNRCFLARNLSGEGHAYDYSAGVFALLSRWEPEIRQKAREVYCSQFADPGHIDHDYEYGIVLLGWSILAREM